MPVMLDSGKNWNLVCVPHAGAGPSAFRDWESPMTFGKPIVASLPGREERFSEACLTSIDAAIADLLGQVQNTSVRSLPFLIFGHSLGAVLGFELARILSVKQGFDLRGLIISGSPAPDASRTAKATGLQDEAFIERLFEFSGVRSAALEHPDLRGLLLPALRSDVELHESYLFDGRCCFDFPIVTIRGKNDSLVSRKAMKGWSKFTAFPIRHFEVSGGHMYDSSDGEGIISLVHSAFEISSSKGRYL
jgi:surfactin synthase thioesterase subunit